MFEQGSDHKPIDTDPPPATESKDVRKAKRSIVTSLANVADDDILRMEDVAAILGDTSPSFAADNVKTGKIRGGFRYGKKTLICAGDLKQFINEQKIGIDRLEQMGYTPEMISWHLPKAQRRAYLESIDTAHGMPEAPPADLPAYERRMNRLVADRHLHRAEADILIGLKENGIVLKGRPKTGPPAARLRSV